MEVYKRETQEVIKRFLARWLGFPECIPALDAVRLLKTLPGVGEILGATIHLEIGDVKRFAQIPTQIPRQHPLRIPCSLRCFCPSL